MSDKYNDLIKDVKEHTLFSLKHFFTLMGLDSEIFNHLYNIPIYVGETIKICIAEYYPNENKIVFSEKELKNSLASMQNEGLSYETQVSNLSLTLIHEILHANRAILIKDGLNKYNSEEFINYMAYNIENFDILQINRNALNRVLDKYDISQFKRYIPFAVICDEGIYEIYTYDLKRQKYVTFANNDVEKFISNEDTMVKISRDIDANKQNYKILSSYEDIYKTEDLILTPEVYYHYLEDIKTQFMSIDDTMSEDEYYMLLTNNLKMIRQRLKKTKALEESMVEGLAYMIEIVDHLDNIDYEYIETFYDCISDDAILAIKMFQAFGDELINWFLLSVYDEQYYDMTSKIFGNDYDEVLKIFYDLYKERKKVKDVEIRFNEIINNNLTRKK